MPHRSRWLVAILIGSLAAAFAAAPAAAGAPKELSHLHVLIAVDTDDVAGQTWGRDGANVKALLEAGFQKQNLADRVTYTVLVGNLVTPEKILSYYRTLKIAPNDGLLFYYSGHGGYQLKRGHFLALTHGNLYRQELIAAMGTSEPKLRVILTDCCANYAGGAFTGEPKNVSVIVSDRVDTGSKPAARRAEPKAEIIAVKTHREQQPPRPDVGEWSGTFKKAPIKEPTAQLAPHVREKPRNFPRARREEPPLAAGVPRRSAPVPTLTTNQGKVPMKEIVDQNDGEVLRHLFFRHEGVVDINGSAKGTFSFGELGWGGSLFTNQLIALQKTKAADFDTNKNKLVEWREFFPQLQRSTDQVSSSLFRNRQKQVPEASQLGSPLAP